MSHPRSSTADSFECNVAAAVVDDDGHRTSVPATLGFDTADPFAVQLDLHVGEDSVVSWTFARQLLAEGGRRAVGIGDVRVRSAFRGGRRVLVVALTSPSGRVDLELPQGRVATFLHDTYAAVPPGLEGDAIDWETEANRFFGTDL